MQLLSSGCMFCYIYMYVLLYLYVCSIIFICMFCYNYMYVLLYLYVYSVIFICMFCYIYMYVLLYLYVCSVIFICMFCYIYPNADIPTWILERLYFTGSTIIWLNSWTSGKMLKLLCPWIIHFDKITDNSFKNYLNSRLKAVSLIALSFPFKYWFNLPILFIFQELLEFIFL